MNEIDRALLESDGGLGMIIVIVLIIIISVVVWIVTNPDNYNE